MHPIFGPNPGKVIDFVAAFANEHPVAIGATYKDLSIEERAYKEEGDAGKKLLTYDKSLARLRAAGFTRHLRPQEAFGLLIDSLEGKLDGAEKAIADDMLTNYGEWLSMAIERKEDILRLYLDPENLVWQNGFYGVQGQLRYAEKREFNIEGVPSQGWVDIDRLPADCVQYVYTRPFHALPKKMRESSNRAQAWLPLKGIWPMGRGSRFGIDYYGSNRASRGVRSAKKSP
jgi:hypothetical protein